MPKETFSIPQIKLSAYHKLIIACNKAKNVQKNILFQVNQNQAHIIINRPQRLNAFTFDMYHILPELIHKANEMENIKYIIIRGNGGNFSSGNDLGGPIVQDLKDPNQIVKAKGELIQRFSLCFIQSKKPIFAIIEGKCIGFVLAMLPLFDKVFATQDAFFTSPLVRLGLCPQIGSSYTFPSVFGQKLAEQIIIKGTQITSKTMEKHNLVKCCKDSKQATQLLNSHLCQLDELDWTSYVTARELMRKNLCQNAQKAIKAEINILKGRWLDPQMPKLVKKQLQREKSLKNKVRPKL